MPRVPEFVAHVIDTLRLFGPVQAKPMFGCWALYRDDVFFALVRHDALYFKVDDANRGDFEARGLAPFVYEMKTGDSITLDYRAAPEETLDDREAMALWARGAYAAALRARAGKRSKAKKRS